MVILLLERYLMNNSMRNRGRSAIYPMAGFYLIYMAYQIFTNRSESSGGEFLAIMAGAIAFLLIGGAMIVFGLYLFYKNGKELQDAAEKRKLQEEGEHRETLDISEKE